MSGGGQIGHDEVADHGAEIESHRSIERELGIDDPRLAFGHHDRSGMEVAVDQRFRRRHEFELEPRDCDMRVEILAEASGRGVEPGRRPAVLLGFAIRIGKDQVLGDLAQCVIAGECGDALFLLRGRYREVGREEQRPR